MNKWATNYCEQWSFWVCWLNYFLSSSNHSLFFISQQWINLSWFVWLLLMLFSIPLFRRTAGTVCRRIKWECPDVSLYDKQMLPHLRLAAVRTQSDDCLLQVVVVWFSLRHQRSTSCLSVCCWTLLPFYRCGCYFICSICGWERMNELKHTKLTAVTA